jgi:hypothetical protein
MAKQIIKQSEAERKVSEILSKSKVELADIKSMTYDG